ncbi:MAG: glucose-1-phosphate cytidylyltransferase [Gemmataceae bacterium]|nr:glucose-1-phosphate cytidylyltransferase [Gemmataceae bacterium]
MKVVILCGGLGTRLREETEYRPKPLVEIGGRPILWHIMQHYCHHGLSEFVLTLGHRGRMIREYFLNYQALTRDFTIRPGTPSSIQFHGEEPTPFTVTLAETGESTMTGGRIARAARYLDGDSFCVTYGDGVSDLDIRTLVRFHRSHGKIATVCAVRLPSRFGVLDLETDGRVRTFAEKPTLDGWASGGYFVFEPAVLDYLAGDSCVLEKEPLERLAADKQLVAFRHDGYFQAMDTYREYLALNDLWSSGAAPWKVWP